MSPHRVKIRALEPLERRQLLTGSAQLLREINPSGSSNASGFVEVGGTVFFSANDGTHGPELWKTDGTTDGTVMVKDLVPGSTGSGPVDLVDRGGTLFFLASKQLWKSDGTADGTVQVTDSAAIHSLASLVNINGTLYFNADDGVHGGELWKSDGTMAGTQMVYDINPTGSSATDRPTQVGNKLYYSAVDATHGNELWVTDTITGDTHLVKDIFQGPFDIIQGHVTLRVTVDNTLYFTAIDVAHGSRLWKTDGTEANTVPVSDMSVGFDSGRAAQMVNINGTLFFDGNDQVSGNELWKTTPAMAGAELVKDINPTAGSLPVELTNVNGTLFFRADDGVHGAELWKSDGSTNGTQMVLDIHPSGSSSPAGFTNADGQLYFAADDGTTGTELWTSNGTTTALAADIHPSSGSFPTNLANAQGSLLFSAYTGTGGGLFNSEPFIVRNPTAVVGRQLFYNQSKFDGNTPGASASDDAAIATDKSAYLPGTGAATWNNMSNYSRGINGVMVDLFGLHGTITAADFIFKVGANNTPSTWADGPAPSSVVVRSGAGVSGADRVELIWTSATAPKNTWLEVIVKGNDATGGFNTNTGLAASDVFFFGNKIGEVGPGSATLAQTTVVDVNSTRSNTGIGASLTNAFDFDRNGTVTVTDVNIARTNTGNLAKINISNPPAAPTSAADPTRAAVTSALAASPQAASLPVKLVPVGVSTRFEPPTSLQLARGAAFAGLAQSAKAIAGRASNVPADSPGLGEDVLDALLDGWAP